MQDLPETLESWQCLTWAVLITVMARILIKSLFMYPGALWSLSGAPVCSSAAASLVCVAMASLTQTAVPPSYSHGRHDEWRRTCCCTHPLREQLSEIEVSHKAGKRQWVIRGKVLLGLCFSGPAPPTPYEPAAPLHKTEHEAVSWPLPVPLNWCSAVHIRWCQGNPLRFLGKGAQPQSKASYTTAGKLSNSREFIKRLKMKFWT